MTNLNNNSIKFIFIIFSALSIIISHNQMGYFHWSTILDQDTMITYNSLLVASGFEQEYRDHPAYTTFLINACIIKFFSLFGIGPLSDINEIIKSENSNEELQKLFFLCRQVNVIFNILLVYFLFKVLKKINLDNLSALLCCLILIFCGYYTESLFFLRNENLSILLFLVSFLFQLKFLNNKKIIFIIFAGVFFGFAMLAKIQIIFLFGIQILIYLIFFNQNIQKNHISNMSKKYDLYLVFIYIIIFFSYLFLQFQLQSFDRFEKIRYLDLAVFIFFNIFYLLFCLFLTNFNLKKTKIFFVYLALFFLGYIFSILITLILDFFNFIQVNPYILLRLTNPIHYMAEFHMYNFPKLYTGSIISFQYFYDLFLIAIDKYHYNFIKIFYLFLVMSFSIYYNFSKGSKNLYINKSLIFLGVLAIIYIINLRDGAFLFYYETYVVVPYVIAIGYYLRNLPKKFIIVFLIPIIFYFLYCNLFLLEKRHKDFDYYFSEQTSMNLICDNDKVFYSHDDKIVTHRKFIKYYNNRFDDNFMDKLCYENN